jgi:hypothetical protein
LPLGCTVVVLRKKSRRDAFKPVLRKELGATLSRENATGEKVVLPLVLTKRCVWAQNRRTTGSSAG